MSKIVVIGGGLAGLSAAVYLSAEHQVLLLESSPKLGGRTYSFVENKTGSTIDNGQHLMMGCYKYTLDFLKQIESEKNIEVFENLDINFVKNDSTQYKLSSGNYFYPLNLLSSILNYSAVNLYDRISLIKFILKIKFTKNSYLKNKTVKEWLLDKKQSNQSIISLWEILVIATMNTTLEKASALLFKIVLKEIFLGGKKSSNIILPRTGLSELFCEPAKIFIEKNNCRILTSERVRRIEFDGDNAIKIIANKNCYDDFDYVISAVPFHALNNIQMNTSETNNYPRLEHSPILNIFIWLDNNPFKERIYGLIDSPIHWIFNHGEYLSITISAANEYMAMKEDEILDFTYSQIEKYFPIFNRKFARYCKIIKEKRATFTPSNLSIDERQFFNSGFKNVVFAGDWTNTGLPSTIEGAVKSGFFAAKKIT
ncbi:MAG: hydroxysqualene dehydroxylase HpnE [Bacteroidota bacterium]